MKKFTLSGSLAFKCLIALVGVFGIIGVSSANFADPATTCSSITIYTESECLALLNIYNTLGGDNRTNTGNRGTDVADWYGVTPLNADSLRTIDLSGNNLSGNLTPYLVSGIELLELLDLSNNNIKGIEDGAFLGAGLYFSWLYLSNNQISDLKDGTFQGLVDTTTSLISLDHNQLTEIKKSDFNGLNTSLGSLNLGYNKITSVEGNTFTDFIYMSDLFLNDNLLTYLYTGIFYGLDSIITADLSNNCIDTSISFVSQYLGAGRRSSQKVCPQIQYTPSTTTSGPVTGTIIYTGGSLTGRNTLNAEDAVTHRWTENGTYAYDLSSLTNSNLLLFTALTGTVTWIEGAPADEAAPLLTITSSMNNTTGSSIVVSGTGYDENGVTAVYVNGSLADGTGNWSATIALNGGVNTIIVTGSDLAGNTGTVTGAIVRINYPSNISSTVLSGTSARIVFTTNISATGYVIYGTTTLDTMTSNTSTDAHNIVLNDLEGATTYYYRVYGLNNGYTGSYSATGTFTTPSAASTSVSEAGTVEGEAFLVGSDENGYTSDLVGTLEISSGSNTIELDLDGLIIEADGGNRDGIILPPTSTTFDGTTPSEDGYTHVSNLTYQMGSEDAELVLGQAATVHLNVGSSYNGKIMHVYRSIDGGSVYSYQADCTVSEGICSFTTDHFSLFTLMSQNSTTSNGGGGGSSPTKDSCPRGDESPSFYDNTCSAKKVKAHNAANILGSTVGSKYSTELNDAYLYAYDNGIISASTIERANIGGELLRSDMAKMIVNYAIKVLDKKALNTGLLCEFDDTNNQAEDMKIYIKLACQMGLMGLNSDGSAAKNFNPNANVSRAEFGTVLSRTLYGNMHNAASGPWYQDHLSTLKNNNIITNTNPNLEEIRGYVMLMLMRAKR